MTKRRVSILAGLVLSSVTGLLAFTARYAAAQPKTVLPRWEQWCTYRHLDLVSLDPEEVLRKLNPELKARGLEGWELAGLAIAGPQAHYCFKRPIP